MYRGIVEQLVLWKNRIDRRPVLLTGAKGVGKTSAAMQFANENYKKKIIFQVDDKQSGFSFYEPMSRQKFDAAINNYTGAGERKEDILLIFDNVNQEKFGENSVEDVLRFIVAYLRDYDICVLTSFHETEVLSKALLAQMDVYRMYPVSLWEFMKTNGDEKLYQAVKRQMECAISEEQQEKLQKYLKVYTVTGGMPYVLGTYMETRSLEAVEKAREQVYRETVHFIETNAPETLRQQAKEVFESVGRQLNRREKEFRHREFGILAKKELYEQAVQWLLKYQLLVRIPHAEGRGFKLYYPDVAMLGYVYGIQFADLLRAEHPYQVNHGAVMEQLVLSQFLSSGKDTKISYWTGKEKSELSFLCQYEGETLPVAMDCGRESSRAVREYRKAYKPEVIVYVTDGELEVAENEIHIPLYSVWNL